MLKAVLGHRAGREPGLPQVFLPKILSHQPPALGFFTLELSWSTA
jgi:hypothetical protein